MDNYCGANCKICSFRSQCRGCLATEGSPFCGHCVAAEYIKNFGLDNYHTFKKQLLMEINKLLASEGLPAADKLVELIGSVVNLPYPTPSGKEVKLLRDNDIYLGTQLEWNGLCFGVIADTTFFLICSYLPGGKEPEIVLYKKR